MLDKIKNIYEKNKDIEYGWKDSKGIVHNQINEGYVRKFSLQTTGELRKTRCGNCWETVELTREELENNKIPCETYFFVVPMQKFYCHSIIVTKIDNDYYWIENSFKNFKGIRKYDSLESIIFDVLNNFHLIVSDKNFNIKNLKIYNYTKPKDHISCIEYYFHCFRSNNITKKYIPKYIKSIEQKQVK
ncbi:MAG: hypothetical protein ACI33S_03170 [Bacilli bacterium]